MALATVVGCSTVPITGSAPPRESHAISEPNTTRLGRLLERHAPSKAHSGLGMLTTGHDTLSTLRELVAAAERSLDLQYYAWRKDGTGKLLMAEIVGAADRGVRVRLLLDDWRPSWSDDDLLTLDTHPGIEVRLFNPRRSRTTPVLDVLFDFRRITHRMHNKMLIADNVATVLGGRNVGDEYLVAGSAAQYRDLDLLSVGPVTWEASAVFDAHWNSPWSVPVERVPRAQAMVGDGRILERRLQAAKDIIPATARATAPTTDGIRKRFVGLIWARSATVVADAPTKPATSTSVLLRELWDRLAGKLDDDLLIEVAYLIPRRADIRALCRLADRGARVRILTNSLGTTDVIATYAAYHEVRPELLRCGVELYEFREREGVALHTKAAVIDGRHVLVGSFNIDPRSINLNTEVAVLVESRELAGAVTRFVEDGLAPERASRLELDGDGIVWIRSEDRRLVARESEPGRTFWRGLYSDLLVLLPIEGQL